MFGCSNAIGKMTLLKVFDSGDCTWVTVSNHLYSHRFASAVFLAKIQTQPQISRIFRFSRKFGKTGYQPKIYAIQLKFPKKMRCIMACWRAISVAYPFAGHTELQNRRVMAYSHQLANRIYGTPGLEMTYVTFRRRQHKASGSLQRNLLRHNTHIR